MLFYAVIYFFFLESKSAIAPLKASHPAGKPGNANVKIQTKAKVESIDEEGVTYTDANGNKISVPEVTVVSAFGYRSYNPLEDAAKKICDNVQVISGAAKVGNALVAIAEGYTAALNL